MDKTIKDYKDEELDKLELESYRALDTLQGQLQQYRNNLIAIQQERASREEKKEVVEAPKEPEIDESK